MNFLKWLTITGVLSAALSLSAVAQTSDEIEISFGSLYGIDPATTVLSGSGELGSSLVGDTFYWVCLDAGQDQPSLSIENYNVSIDPSVLQAGTWSGTLGADARLGITTAATNMFYAYQDVLMDPSRGDARYSFQSALWGVTFSYIYWGATGPLSSSVMDEVISRYNIYFEDEPWLETFLDAALITPTVPTTVYFANPTNNSELQPVMLFAVNPVPEPSGMMLVGLAGLLGILRRRRSA